MLDQLHNQGWYTTAEAARYLGCARIYVDKLMRKGLLPRRQIMDRLLFHIRDLEAYKASHPRLGLRRNAG